MIYVEPINIKKLKLNFIQATLYVNDNKYHNLNPTIHYI